MTKFDKLRHEALTSCKNRGHKMKLMIKDKFDSWYMCKTCGRDCYITTTPLPNNTKISGGAVALECSGIKK